MALTFLVAAKPFRESRREEEQEQVDRENSSVK
jgi:hypothetical protein